MSKHLVVAALFTAAAACAHNAAMPEPAGVSSAAPAPRAEATPRPLPAPAPTPAPGSASATAPAANAAASDVKAAAAYACPMHKDVTSTKPGSCSKCGMALSAVTPAAGQGAAKK